MEHRSGDSGQGVGPQLDVEVELVKERAEALGRAGRSLQEAITARRSALLAAGGELPPSDDDRLLAAITSCLYRLVIQRECSGARHGNLEAIRAAYDVPDAAIRRM